MNENSKASTGINHSQLETDAKEAGLISYTDNGRTKVEGRTGDVVKVFAAQGADVIRDGKTSYKVMLGGVCVGIILTGQEGDVVPQTWSYGFTTK